MIKNGLAVIGALAVLVALTSALNLISNAETKQAKLEDQLAKCRTQNEARAEYVDSLSRCCWVQSRDGGEVYLQIPRVLP